MKKVLFLISTLTGGGAERTLCNITLALPGEVEVDILVNSESDKDYPHKGNVISLNFPKQKKLSLAYQIKSVIHRMITLRKLKKNGYDACISFMDSANIANILSGGKKCKTILTVHTYLSNRTSVGYKYIVCPLAKLLYTKADKVVAVSKGVEQDLVKRFHILPDKAATIYNAFDIALIQDKAKQPVGIDLKEECFYFISVGRLCEEKGQWHLIRAFTKVVEKYPNSRLLILGQGAYDAMYRQMVKEYEIEDKVIFGGFVENPFAVASKCDVCVLTSLCEGFGNIIIENMACGLPIISTDFRYGAREILAPNTDFEFQQKEEVELAQYGVITPVCSGKKGAANEPLEKEEVLLGQAMLRLLEDKELCEQYRRKSLERAEDFELKRAVEQWVQLL